MLILQPMRIQMTTTINKPLHSNNREAIEIFNYIKERLNIPDNVIEMTLKFKHNDLVTVECTYYPSRKENP